MLFNLIIFVQTKLSISLASVSTKAPRALKMKAKKDKFYKLLLKKDRGTNKLSKSIITVIITVMNVVEIFFSLAQRATWKKIKAIVKPFPLMASES